MAASEHDAKRIPRPHARENGRQCSQRREPRGYSPARFPHAGELAHAGHGREARHAPHAGQLPRHAACSPRRTLATLADGREARRTLASLADGRHAPSRTLATLAIIATAATLRKRKTPLALCERGLGVSIAGELALAGQLQRERKCPIILAASLAVKIRF